MVAATTPHEDHRGDRAQSVTTRVTTPTPVTAKCHTSAPLLPGNATGIERLAMKLDLDLDSGHDHLDTTLDICLGCSVTVDHLTQKPSGLQELAIKQSSLGERGPQLAWPWPLPQRRFLTPPCLFATLQEVAEGPEFRPPYRPGSRSDLSDVCEHHAMLAHILLTRSLSFPPDRRRSRNRLQGVQYILDLDEVAISVDAGVDAGAGEVRCCGSQLTAHGRCWSIHRRIRPITRRSCQPWAITAARTLARN